MRLNAPVFGSRSHAPLSLAAAVNGTLAGKKHKQRVNAATLEESKPKSWFFDIYEETEEQQNFVVNEWTMTQSACTLDISDDERKTPTKDERGKENIPPNEIHFSTTNPPTASPSYQIAASRKDMMTDEPRTPLGDLNPTEYYAEGCDATSVTLVAEEAPEPEQQPALIAADHIEAQAAYIGFNFNAELPPTDDSQDKLMTKSELSGLLFNATPTTLPYQHDDVEAGLLDNKCNEDVDAEIPEPADIEIWESGSAKDDSGEMEAGESIFAGL
jgi:hypothetical protein